MLAQMRKNGVADGLATIEQYDVAAKQLRDAGLLTVNKNAVANQKAAEIEQLAADYQAIAFDEEAAYSLPLEEVRRRAGLVNR
jgi:spermidine synthase